MSRSFIIILSLSLTLVGCAVIPQKPQKSGSIISSTVFLDFDDGNLAKAADKLYFAKLDDANNLERGKIIESNYQKNKRVYLLDASPGNYILVAASIRVVVYNQYPVSFNNIVYFPYELIKKTRLTVGSGTFLTEGVILVNATRHCDKADEIQIHYGESILPNSTKDSFIDRFKTGVNGFVAYCGLTYGIARNPSVRASLVKDAKDALGSDGWIIR